MLDDFSHTFIVWLTLYIVYMYTFINLYVIYKTKKEEKSSKGYTCIHVNTTTFRDIGTYNFINIVIIEK